MVAKIFRKVFLGMKYIPVLLVSTVLMFSCVDDEVIVKEFSNPVLAGFYPDPSICSVDSDYYLVNSTFAYFPGIPVFHSKDLVHWELIGHAMDRIEQMDLDGYGVSRGIFAPAIRYNDGIFYITCTLVDGQGNFVVTSDKPGGPYSNPVWIPEINGIDPSMFFDKNGKAYILYNSIAPDDKPLYDGHRTIRMYEFDLKELKVTGQEKILVNGGVDINKKPVWIEGPHIFQKDGYYYLIAAEGGTAEDHSEVVFRSENVDGPYVPYEKNPILTQRHLDPKRNNPITSTGHADFVMTETGDWWAVFLGCRPYEGDYYNTGRETFLAPVKWIDEWPVINPDFAEVQYSYPYPTTITGSVTGKLYGGNFKIRDEFDKSKLDPDWIFLRTPKEQWYKTNPSEGYIEINLRSETCSENVNPSFIGRRQQHLEGSIIASLNFETKRENEKAGLIVFQNDKAFYYLCKSHDNNNDVIQLFESSGADDNAAAMKLLHSETLRDGKSDELFLKIEAKRNVYSFFYGYTSDVWHPLVTNVDASLLSTKKAGGFVGCVYAMYCTSMGKESQNSARFNWFEYAGFDKIYEMKR